MADLVKQTMALQDGNTMPKAITVLLISNDSDMTVERTHVRHHLESNTRTYARDHGYDLTILDINHGLSSLQSLHTPFSSLLDSSHLLTHERVVVAGLIGSKHGTRLLPQSISNAVYEAALAAAPNGSAKLLFQTWYQQDATTLEPSYRLEQAALKLPGFDGPATSKGRGGRQQARARWAEESSILASMLSSASEKTGQADSLPQSPLELGVNVGLQAAAENKGHAWFCQRQFKGGVPTNLAEADVIAQYLDLDAEGKPDERAKQAIADLWQSIEMTQTSNVSSMTEQVTWVGQGINREDAGHRQYLKGMTNSLDSFVRAQVDAAVAQDASNAPDPLTMELSTHASTLRHYLHFNAPATTVDTLLNRLKEATTGITLVSGRVGQLTQVAVAHALQQTASFKPDTALLIRCVKATAASSSLLSLLQSICQQLCRLAGANEEALPVTLGSLLQRIKFQAKALPEHVVIALWDLEGLAPTLASGVLNNVLDALSVDCHVILSSTAPVLASKKGKQPKGLCATLHQALPDSTLIEVANCTVDEVTQHVAKVTDQYRHRLTDAHQQSLLVAARSCNNPLYCHLAIFQAMQWGVDSNAKHPKLPNNLKDLVASYIDHLNTAFSQELVHSVFGALLTAPYGLALHELADVVSLIDEALLASFSNDPVMIEEGTARCASLRVLDLIYTARRFGLLTILDSRYGQLARFGHPEVALIVAHCLEPMLLAGAAKNVVAYFRGEHANSRKPLLVGKAKQPVSRLVPSQEPRHELAHANSRLLVSLPSLLKLAEQEELLDASCIFKFEFLQALVDDQGVLGLMHLIELANAPGDRIGEHHRDFVHGRRLWQDAMLASLRTLQQDRQQLAGQIIGRLAGLSQYVSIKELVEAAQKYANDPSSMRLIPEYECLHNPGRCNHIIAQLSSNPCGPIIVVNGDSVKVVCGRDDGALTLIEQDLMGGYLTDSKGLPNLEAAGAPRALAYSGGRTDVVAVLREDRCDVYASIAGQATLRPTTSYDVQDAECVGISEDGTILAVGTNGGDLVICRDGATAASVCDPESGLVQILIEDDGTAVAVSDTKLFLHVPGQDVCLASESIDAELLCLSRGHSLYAVETHDHQTRLVLYRWTEEDGVLTLGQPYSGPMLGSSVEEEALTMAVSANNQYLAVAMSHEIVLLEIAAGAHDTSTSSLTSTTIATLAACFTRPRAELSCVDHLFVSDDGEVASSGEDCTLCYWSTMPPANKKSRKRGDPERSVSQAALESRMRDYHTANTSYFALSTAQQHALSASSEEILVWDLHTGHVESRLPLRSPQRAFVPNGAGSWPRYYKSVNVKGTDYVLVPLARPDDLSRCDGWMLLQAAKGDVVVCHESPDEVTALVCFGQHEQVVVLCAKANSTLAAFDAAGKRLAVLEEVDCVFMHVSAKGIPLLMLEGGELATVTLRDDQLVLATLDLGDAHLEASTAVMCTTVNDHVMVSTVDGAIMVDVDKAVICQTLTGFSGAIAAMASSDEKLVVCDANNLVVWDLASGNKEARLTHDSPLRCCQISPKGLVVTATEHQIQTWSLVEERVAATFASDTRIESLHIPPTSRSAQETLYIGLSRGPVVPMKLPRLAKDRAKQRGMAMFGGSMGAMVDPTQILAAKGNLRASSAVPNNVKLLPQPEAKENEIQQRLHQLKHSRAAVDEVATEEEDAFNVSATSAMSDGRPITPLAGVGGDVDLSSPDQQRTGQEQSSMAGSVNESSVVSSAAPEETKSGGCCCVVQ
eukprot:m.247203 g.247203  ORF g.247203 m.247203 type:complete len:1748 (+) comp17480_c0_seq3:112-5355(+)